jgi:hypothetical protein
VTHAEWLAGRKPAAPTGLQAHLQRLFGEHPEWNALALPEAMVAASELLLARVLASDASARCVATDLLAADACVTFAFEAAADDPPSIAGLAERAMNRIAAAAGAATLQPSPPHD